MSLPTVETIRQRIEAVEEPEVRYCLMTAYLFAGRISEVVSRATPGDTTTARGPKGTDVKREIYKIGSLEEPAVVFTVRTAKRNGKERSVGLPLNPEFEPWAERLYDYFREFGKDFVFPFTRQKMWRHSQEVFDGLTYPIERYIVFITEGEVKTRKIVNEHIRKFRLHALRHLRTTELVSSYGFNGVNLSTYGGWTLQRGAGISNVMARYINLSWQSYFPKLLKERM